MSPVNNDDSSGEDLGGGEPALTRKEIRAREKSLSTQGHDVIPPQAFEAPEAHDTPQAPAADVNPAPAAEAAPAEQSPAEETAPTADAGPLEETAPTADVGPVPAGEAYSYAGPREGREHAGYGTFTHGGAAEFLPADYGMADHEAADYGTADHGAADYGTADYHPADYDDQGDHPEDLHADEHYVMAGAGAKGPSKKIRRRRRFLALVLSLTVFVAAIAIGAQFLKPLLGADAATDYPGPGTGEILITVPQGAGAKSVASDLQAQDVVASADSFLKEFIGSGGALVPGEFTMRKQMKNSDAVAVLLNQDQAKVMYVALNAGLRVEESLQAISEGTGAPVQELQALNANPGQFGVPDPAKNLEGFLAPGEYRFPLGTPAKEVIQKLVNTTLDELKEQGVTDPKKQYDTVTIASIVQAEGGQAEYGDVAGAIYNRLKPNNTETNGLIQSDATVTYGLGIKSFHIDEDQKRDKSNPYNTYANQGLPVGPIGSPGKRAIDAAANPTDNEFLYWVTINLDTKETRFSKTLAEHNVYVEMYNTWCGKNPGRCV